MTQTPDKLQWLREVFAAYPRPSRPQRQYLKEALERDRKERG